jgi:hypothetical protein
MDAAINADLDRDAAAADRLAQAPAGVSEPPATSVPPAAALASEAPSAPQAALSQPPLASVEQPAAAEPTPRVLSDEEFMAAKPADISPAAPPIAGKSIDGDWTQFTPESGTLNVPRASMPQIKAEHRGAMVNFLEARGIGHQEETVPATDLKPTQAEFSTKKVEKAKGYEGGDRSILVSSDGYVLDGHHQWMAKRDAGEPVKIIRLDAPIRELLPVVAEFPSATSAAPSQAPEANRDNQPENSSVPESAEHYSLVQTTHEALGEPKPAAGIDDRVFNIVQNGETVGRANIRVNGAAAEIRDIYSIKGPISKIGSNTLGPSAVRSLMRQFLTENPEVKSFTGERVSGARTRGVHKLAGEGTNVEIAAEPPAQTALKEKLAANRDEAAQARFSIRKVREGKENKEAHRSRQCSACRRPKRSVRWSRRSLAEPARLSRRCSAASESASAPLLATTARSRRRDSIANWIADEVAFEMQEGPAGPVRRWLVLVEIPGVPSTSSASASQS